jgi:hypothetical protein
LRTEGYFNQAAWQDVTGESFGNLVIEQIPQSGDVDSDTRIFFHSELVIPVYPFRNTAAAP